MKLKAKRSWVWEDARRVFLGYFPTFTLYGRPVCAVVYRLESRWPSRTVSLISWNVWIPPCLRAYPQANRQMNPRQSRLGVPSVTHLGTAFNLFLDCYIKNPILWGSKSSIWSISIFIFISSLDFAQNRGPILSDFPVASNRYCIGFYVELYETKRR